MGFFWEQITSDFFLWHPSLVTRFQKKKKKKRKEKKRKRKKKGGSKNVFCVYNVWILLCIFWHLIIKIIS